MIRDFPQTHSPIWKIIVKQPTAVHHRASCAYPVPRLQTHCSNTWHTDANATITRQQITVQADILSAHKMELYIFMSNRDRVEFYQWYPEGSGKGSLFFHSAGRAQVYEI